jgi:hypothetical protein
LQLRATVLLELSQQGRIPTEIGRLASLTQLALHGNRLTGES